MNGIHIDGDFPTGKGCEHHCSPTCHPAQVGPEWVYGCTHPAWPHNRNGDFVPIVDCGGDPAKCDLCRRTKHLGRYIVGLPPMEIADMDLSCFDWREINQPDDAGFHNHVRWR